MTTTRTTFGGHHIDGSKVIMRVHSPGTYKLRIFDAWDFLNDAAFDGEMTRPKIVVWEHLYCRDTKGRKVKLSGAYEPSTSRIFIWWKCKAALHTLYHEMVHQYAVEILEADIGHSPAYWELYDEGYEKINKYIKKVQRECR